MGKREVVDQSRHGMIHRKIYDWATRRVVELLSAIIVKGDDLSPNVPAAAEGTKSK